MPMAEAKDKKTDKAEKADPKAAKAAAPAPKARKAGLKRIVMLAVAAVLAAVAGIGASIVVRGAGPKAASAANPDDPFEEFGPDTDDEQFQYRTMDRLTVSLKNDRGTTFLIAVVVLKIRAPHFDIVQQRLDAKKHEVKDMLNTYLAGLTAKEVLGTTNQNRIKRELRDRLNNLLWPGKRPGIHAVLFEEFHTN